VIFKNKRGVYFFILDVVIAILIFMVTVLIISNFFIPKPSISGTEQTINILSSDLFTLPLTQLSENTTNKIPEEYLINSVSVDEYIYLLELKGNHSFAKEIVKEILEFWPGNYGFKYYIDTINVTVFEKNTSLGISINQSNTLLSRYKVTVLNTYPSFTNPVLSEVNVWN